MVQVRAVATRRTPKQRNTKSRKPVHDVRTTEFATTELERFNNETKTRQRTPWLYSLRTLREPQTSKATRHGRRPSHKKQKSGGGVWQHFPARRRARQRGITLRFSTRKRAYSARPWPFRFSRVCTMMGNRFSYPPRAAITATMLPFSPPPAYRERDKRREN